MRYGKGPLGALMDEYERVAEEFCGRISRLESHDYDAPILQASERDLVSIGKICYHVLFAGYAYADALRRKFGKSVASPVRFYPTQTEFESVFRAMLTYTEDSLADLYHMTDDDLTATNIPLRWSDHHDLEAVMEHAIVHVLRHRRQIEYELAHRKPAVRS